MNQNSLWKGGSGILIVLFSIQLLFLGSLPLTSQGEVSAESQISKDIPKAHYINASEGFPGYNRDAAYGYALQWYNGRNTNFNDYTGSGGNCANFVSQIMIAGGLSLHEGTDGTGYGVYPDQDRPWASTASNGTMPYCDYLHLNLVNYQETVVTYVTDSNATVPDYVDIGDVITFGYHGGNTWAHAMAVVTLGDGTVGLAGHTSDVWDADFFALMNSFTCATIYHFNYSSIPYHQFRVTASNLNVRVGPGLDNRGELYDSIAQISNGQEYVALGYAFDEQDRMWWKFQLDERVAWCAAWFTENVTTPTTQPIQITSTAVNIREGPGTGYTAVSVGFKGANYVANHKEPNGWYRIYYGGQELYVSGSVVDEIQVISEMNYTPFNPPVKNIVMGFLPHWISSNRNFTPLTHLAWFSVEMAADGSITNTNGWPQTDIVDNVRAANRSIILTVTMFNDNDISTLISTPAYRQTAVQNLLQLVEDGQADGINIDFEFPKQAGDEVHLVDFMALLNHTFKTRSPHFHVSLCTPAVDWWDTFDYGALSPHTDAFMVMGYGYYWSGSPNAGPTAPLDAPGYDLKFTVNQHLSRGANRDQIVLGLPFYGYDYPVVDNTKHSETRGSGSAITYSQNINKINSLSPTVYYDETYQASYYHYHDGEGWREVWCESYESLEAKMDYILSEELGGLGIWAWGLHGNKYELEELVMRKMKTDPIPPEVNILSPANEATFTDSIIVVEWEAFDNIELDQSAVRVNEGPWIEVGKEFSYEFDLTNGDYLIEVRVNDTSGNEAFASVSVIVDAPVPDDLEVNIISPLNDTVLTSSVFDVEWSATGSLPLDRSAVRVNEGAWIDVGAEFSYEFDLTNGDYLIEVRINDTSGNEAFSSVSVIVDAPVPDDLEVDILSPLNETVLTNSVFIVEWSATGSLPLDQSAVRVNEGPWIDVGEEFSYEFDLTNGDYLIEVRVNDTSGNEAFSSVSVIVDVPTEDNGSELPPPDENGSESPPQENGESEDPLPQDSRNQYPIGLYGAILGIVGLLSIFIIKRKRS